MTAAAEPRRRRSAAGPGGGRRIRERVVSTRSRSTTKALRAAAAAKLASNGRPRGEPLLGREINAISTARSIEQSLADGRGGAKKN